MDQPIDRPGSTPALGRLSSEPAIGRPDLLAAPVRAALEAWGHAPRVGVAAIDPGLADTATLSATYDLPLRAGGNCVVVGGRRGGEERVAACLVPADTRADVNGLVKRLLDVRKCSFLGVDEAVSRTGMEYGGITPLGLPPHWRLLVDGALLTVPVVVVGAGVRRAKLLLAGRLLADLPGAETVVGLGRTP